MSILSLTPRLHSDYSVRIFYVHGFNVCDSRWQSSTRYFTASKSCEHLSYFLLPLLFFHKISCTVYDKGMALWTWSYWGETSLHEDMTTLLGIHCGNDVLNWSFLNALSLVLVLSNGIFTTHVSQRRVKKENKMPIKYIKALKYSWIGDIIWLSRK